MNESDLIKKKIKELTQAFVEMDVNYFKLGSKIINSSNDTEIYSFKHGRKMIKLQQGNIIKAIQQLEGNLVQARNREQIQQESQNRISRIHSQRMDLLDKEIELERLRAENNKAAMNDLDNFYKKMQED